MRRILRFWPVVVVTLLLYLPLISNPALFLDRGNDLQEFFWPALYFVKEQILQNHALPLWNPMYLSGYPLIADPQSPLFYLPNIIIWLLPINTGIILSIILHTVAAAGLFYLLSNKAFSLDHKSSLFASLIYILIPRLSAYLEAGHLGLIFAHTWIPLAIYAAIKISKDRRIKFAIYYAIALAMLFFTHTITFLIISVSCGMVALINFLLNRSVNLKYFFFRLTTAHITLFGFVAIALLPQLAWSGLSTRQLLLTHPETYPLWNSKLDFIKAIFMSWGSSKLDTEKVITLGIMPLILSFFAFLKLNQKIRLVLIGALACILLIVMNNASPIYQILISQNWFVLMRVATRIWIVPTIIVCLLSALATSKIKSKPLAYLIMTLTVGELFFLSWKIQAKQPPTISNVVPQQIIDFIKSDKDHFRVFCTSGCISQKTAVVDGIELVEGYNTLQQMNYYQYAWQWSGEWWNYYTLAIPPFGIRHQELQNLDTNALGLLNIKYIVSPYKIRNKNLKLVNEANGYILYLNEEYLPRAFTWPERNPVTILDYKPDRIVLDTFNTENNTQIVLSEIYSPGWTANRQNIKEGPSILRSFNTNGSRAEISIYYYPPFFKLGTILTVLTSLFIVINIKKIFNN